MGDCLIVEFFVVFENLVGVFVLVVLYYVVYGDLVIFV